MRVALNFYMLAYIIDHVYAKNIFPLMKWSWSSTQVSMHIYCSKLWNGRIIFMKYVIIL